MNRSMHAAFKQMLVAGLHCMDIVLSVNGNNQDCISAAECVRLASKLGVRAEQHEIEYVFLRPSQGDVPVAAVLDASFITRLGSCSS